MPVISLVNVKGGVGKTMTAINLSGEIAQYGKVLLIDNDPQANVTQILNIKHEYSMNDLYSNNRVKFKDCIAQYKGNLYVIPNNLDTADLAETIRLKDKELILKSKFEKYDNEFDFIIIDNTPYKGLFMRNSLAMSDYYIEVIDNSPSALQGLNMVNKLVSELKENEINTKLKLLGILRSMFDKSTGFTRQMNEVLVDNLDKDLFDTIIYDSVRYAEANALHCTIHEYKKDYAVPYTYLLEEIIKRIKTMS